MKKSFGSKTLAIPNPVWCVGSYDAKDQPNLMTIAWGGICCSSPPAVTISLRKATPAPSENGEAYDMIIVSMDITGNEAVVKVQDLYLGLRFTDYLSLLKIENSWVIVNKVYYYEPK